jgi:Ca2+-binding RTX toxin-like protein
VVDYIYWTLPMPVVAEVGQSVSLADIFSQSFGGLPANAGSFLSAYFGAQDLANRDFDYWNPSAPSLDRWTFNGTDIGPGFFHQTGFYMSQASQVALTMGNVIGPTSFVMIPTAWNEQNQITQYTEYHIMTIEPDLMLDTAGSKAPTAQDIVDQAYLFDERYGSPVNSNDCHLIAGAVAASAGATMPMYGNTQNVIDPSQNIESGFWRIAYRGSDPNPVADWQTLVKPGDIVRMGWTNGGYHTATVLAVSADKKTMTVYDNTADGGKIGIHDVTFDSITRPGSITIYRLTTDNMYLSNGSTQGESISGTIFNDEVHGLGGADTLYGAKGNDWLDGGLDIDTLSGGIGNDTYVVDNAGDTITEADDAGSDTILTSVSYTLSADVSVETLSTTSSTGTDAIDLVGNGLDQSLRGNNGTNRIDGKGGEDRMTGYGGNDTYYVDSGKDVIVEASDKGSDTVRASVSYDLDDDVSVETLMTSSTTSTKALNLTGNDLVQSIRGNNGDNRIDGKGGADRMTGYDGDDTYYVDHSRDQVIEAAGEGSDTVRASVSFTLAADTEVENLLAASASSTRGLDLTGNAVGQKITGNAGVNTIDGGAGRDTLRGGLGNDVFVFSTALGGGNIDTLADFRRSSGNHDRIQLDEAVFTKLGDGVLSSSHFRANSDGLARDGNDYIVYDTDSGRLYYDADGSGSGKAIHFATLADEPALAASDFFI